MRHLAVLLLVFALAWPASALAQAKPKPYKIAILEFDPVTAEAEKDNLGRVTAEFLITSAVNSGSFGVVERAALKKVLDEMQFGRGSNAPGTAAQAIGAMVGAQGVLTGSVAKTGSSVRLDARLVDVSSGNIVAARSAYAKSDLRSIATAAELLISQLEGDLSRLTPAEAKPETKAESERKPEAKPEPGPEQKSEAKPEQKAEQVSGRALEPKGGQKQEGGPEQKAEQRPEQRPESGQPASPATNPDEKVPVNQ